MSDQDTRITLADLAHVHAPDLRRFAEVWLAARGEAVMPARSALDPLEMPRLLPHLWLCAYEPDSERFVYRLAGEAINAVYGHSLRGLDLSGILPPQGYEIVRKRYLHVVTRPAAVHTSGRIYLHNRRFHAGERLILPLADDSGHPAFVVGATVVVGDWDYPEPEDLARDHRTTVTPLVHDGDGVRHEDFLGDPRT